MTKTDEFEKVWSTEKVFPWAGADFVGYWDMTTVLAPLLTALD